MFLYILSFPVALCHLQYPLDGKRVVCRLLSDLYGGGEGFDEVIKGGICDHVCRNNGENSESLKYFNVSKYFATDCHDGMSKTFFENNHKNIIEKNCTMASERLHPRSAVRCGGEPPQPPLPPPPHFPVLNVFGVLFLSTAMACLGSLSRRGGQAPV
jgi:hypothetical protein